VSKEFWSKGCISSYFGVIAWVLTFRDAIIGIAISISSVIYLFGLRSIVSFAMFL